jgi:chromosomal replication initiator protein
MYGTQGLGKTHLLQAIGNYVENNYSDMKVKYAPAKNFFSELDNALAKGKHRDYVSDLKNTDVFLIDDFNEVSQDKKTQDLVNKIFNNFIKNGKQIVITGDRPIESIKSLEKNLSAIFKDALNLKLADQDPELRKEILRRHVSDISVKLLEDLIENSAEKEQNDLDQLKKEIAKAIKTNSKEK